MVARESLQISFSGGTGVVVVVVVVVVVAVVAAATAATAAVAGGVVAVVLVMRLWFGLWLWLFPLLLLVVVAAVYVVCFNICLFVRLCGVFSSTCVFFNAAVGVSFPVGCILLISRVGHLGIGAVVRCSTITACMRFF